MTTNDRPQRPNIRPTNKIKSIGALQKENPNKLYKGIRIDDEFDPNGDNLDKYLERGWEIVSTAEIGGFKDDRTTAPGSKKEDPRATPAIRKGKGKAQFLYISIDKELNKSNKENDAQINKDRYLRANKLKQTQQGNSVKTVAPEVNENNLKNEE